jgi:predicted AAA+ superfamily ATPase
MKKQQVMKRLLYDKIRTRIDDKRYIIITGPRQVGKTTIMKQLYDDLINKYQNAFFISLENPTIYNILNEHPENLFKYVTKPPEMVNDVSEKYYVFIDEIQYLENPSNFLKYNYDMYSHTLKLVVSGSSAFYIDKKFDDSLAGRKWLYNMMTMSFEEFLCFRGYNDLIPELKKIRLSGSDYTVVLNQLYILLDEYISYGGYPAVVLEKNTDEKKNILYEITNTFVKRDVLESGIAEEEKLLNLMKLLAQNPGSFMNYNSYAKTLKVSPHTVENYIYTLRKCFHIHLLKPYFTNIGKSIRKMSKYYFNDIGFRNSLANDFRNISNRQDKGHLFENYVFTRLRDSNNPDNIYFWRTSDGNEIDFLIENNFRQGNAFKVKFDGMEYNKNKYNLFMKNYPAYILNGISYNGANNTKSGLNI